MAMTDAWSLQL